MSQTIKISNFRSSNIVETTELSADAAVGSGIAGLAVDNNNNIIAADLLYFGQLGTETGEVKTVQTISGANTIALTANLNFKHLRNDPVTKLFGNQIRVYRAANVNGLAPADSDFALFASSTINIDYDQQETIFTDPAGSNAYWYKFTYYNSVALTETSLADSVAVRGGGYGNYCSLDAIRQEAGFKRNKFITDDVIDAKRQAAQATINSMLAGVYALPFSTPVNPLIVDITKRLAAGWLLLEQYGHDALNTQNGQKKVDSVMNDKETGDLNRLQLGSIVLTDANGGSMKISTSATGFNGWPNGTTKDATTDDHGGDHMFRIGGVRGYQTRDY